MQGNKAIGGEIVIVPPQPVDISNLPLITDLQYLEPFGSESLNRKFYGIIPPGVYRGFRSSLAGGMILRIGRENETGTAIVELNGEHCLTVQQRSPVDVLVPAGFSGFVVIEAFYQFGVPTSQVDLSSTIEAVRLRLVSKAQLNPSHVILYALNVPANAKALTSAMISDGGRNDVSISTDSNIYNLLDDHLKGLSSHPISGVDGLQGILDAALLREVTLSTGVIDNMARHVELMFRVMALEDMSKTT